MANIKCFQAYRPNVGLESQIAALPYDVYNRAEAKEYVKHHPLSFLKIDRPETYFPDGYDMYAPEVYQKARTELQNMIDNSQFVKDACPGFYLYELTMQGRTQTGIVACASIDDYLNNVIKKHENTRAEKEADRINHIDVCEMQTGPIFLAYRQNADLRAIILKVKQTDCSFDFTTEDNIRHRGWNIFDANLIREITDIFSNIESLYIADGHHRAASAVKVGLKRRLEHAEYTGDESFNYFLSVLFSDEELMIMDYNRVVKDLNGLSNEEFLEKIQEKYVLQHSSKPVAPQIKGELGMCLDGEWYKLLLKDAYKSNHPVNGLDVAILQSEVLAPILNIDDPRTNARIDFVGGIRGLDELERRVASDCRVAFAMYPTSISELFAVADAGLLMPPKSTWFEPKLRSGLFLNSLKSSNK